MPEPIDFYFDFSSPYGYVGACRVEEMAARHGREVAWRPYLMGASFQVTGRQPLLSVPLVGEYSRRDLARTVRLHQVPFSLPEKFPVMTVGAARAFYWIADRDVDAAKRFALAVFRAYFADGRDISDNEVVADIAAEGSEDREGLIGAIGDQAMKDRLRAETDAALERGVFGSPFFLVDGEPFWGNDHMDQVERWLETGGW